MDADARSRIEFVSPAPGVRDRAFVTFSGPSLALWSATDGLTACEFPAADITEPLWSSADGTAVFRLRDRGGDETGHVVRRDVVGPDGGGHDGADHDLTPDLDPYVLRGAQVSAGGRWVALNPVTDRGWDLVLAPSDPRALAGPVRSLFRADTESWNCRIGADAALATLDTTAHEPGRRRWAVTAFDAATGDVLAVLRAEPGLAVTAVAITGREVLVAEERGPLGMIRPALWDPTTGAVHRPSVPDVPDDADLRPVDRSSDGRHLLLCREHLAVQRLLVHDLRTGATTELDLPPGSAHSPDEGRRSWFGPDGDVFACWTSAREPLRLLRASDRRPAATALPSPVRDPAAVEYRSITASSDDGVPVQAWVALPPGPGPHPVVVTVHGGPHDVMLDRYDPLAQRWVDAGFGYVEVNYRGSIGRGRAFAERVYGDVGARELADVAAVHQMLLDTGVTEPGRAVLAGASYGGFLTLLGMGTQPDRWAAGIAQIAIGDWVLAHRDAAEATRGAFNTWFGATPQQRPDLYRERSPITHLDRVRAPIMIRQGRHDTRTTPVQLTAYLDRAGELGREVSVEWFDGGHSIAEPDSDFTRLAIDLARRVTGAARS